VLYGEEMNPRVGFEFFKHLSECPDCNREYLELLETREKLGDWKVEYQRENDFEISQASFAFPPLLKRVRWWPLLQKVAAGFLIVVGAMSIFQYMGYWGGKPLVVSERQLTETVQDMILAQQTQERQLMLRALLRVKEDIELRERDNFGQLQQYLITLEQRYIENIEENNHYLRTLLSR
ncbi:hypothetical protein MYX82_14105, partial [Acidobacteria bacterium AH-259-D05]|nr:hypothetical protein [Acidobacteria bacterium AH-259-D05]